MSQEFLPWWATLCYLFGVLIGWVVTKSTEKSRHQIYLEEDLKIQKALRQSNYSQ